jgi:hypothetical protein
MQGAQKPNHKAYLINTLSGEVCSATQQTRRALQGMSVFQQPTANIFVDTFMLLPYKLWAKDRRKTGDIP